MLLTEQPRGLGTHVLPIEAKHSIFSIPRVFKLHKGEPRRVPGDPHGSQRPIVAEGSLQLAFARARAQVPHVHLGLCGRKRGVRAGAAILSAPPVPSRPQHGGGTRCLPPRFPRPLTQNGGGGSGGGRLASLPLSFLPSLAGRSALLGNSPFLRLSARLHSPPPRRPGSSPPP